MFYFLAWFSWVYVTFMMKKDRLRFFLATIILLVIISSQTYISFLGFTMYISGLLLWSVGAVLLAMDTSSTWMSMLYSTILAMIYCMFHFMEIYDPYWLVLPRAYLLSALLCVSSLILVRKMTRRIGVLLIGTFQGECMLGFFLKDIGFHNEIASLDYLAVIALSLGVFVVLHGVKRAWTYIENGKQKQMKGMKGL